MSFVKPDLADGIISHYTEQSESDRLLRSPHGRLEFLRTQCILREHLPPPPARILDVGGATGIHAAWLVKDRYEVHLVDLLAHHVETARKIDGLTASEGDARHLEAEDNSVDVVLLLGPLYHLTEHDDRIRALQEARRVLRPGGFVAAAAINRHTAVLEECATDAFDITRLERMTKVARSGQHDPSLGFTNAHFHSPDELETELIEAGLAEVRVFGVEGPAWPVLDAYGLEEFDMRKAAAMATAQAFELDPTLRVCSAHLLALGTA